MRIGAGLSSLSWLYNLINAKLSYVGSFNSLISVFKRTKQVSVKCAED